MAERKKHLFQFKASRIAVAAAGERDYHKARVAYWQAEVEAAAARVRETIGAKLVEESVTGGKQFNVVVNYGDPAASQRLNQARNKVTWHQEAAARFHTVAELYATQDERVYDLDGDDVHDLRLNGRPRDE